MESSTTNGKLKAKNNSSCSKCPQELVVILSMVNMIEKMNHRDIKAKTRLPCTQLAMFRSVLELQKTM